MPGEAPILVDSAGCGAQLKDYGHLLGTDAAGAFSARVRDIHEWLAEHADRLPAPRHPLEPVIVQDPCHLRHVQRTHLAVRTVLGRYAPLVELDDEGLCCGAGGAYSALHPDLAAAGTGAEAGRHRPGRRRRRGQRQPGLRPPPGRRRASRSATRWSLWPRPCRDASARLGLASLRPCRGSSIRRPTTAPAGLTARIR